MVLHGWLRLKLTVWLCSHSNRRRCRTFAALGTCCQPDGVLQVRIEAGQIVRFRVADPPGNGRGGDREKWIIKLQLYRPSSCVLVVDHHRPLIYPLHRYCTWGVGHCAIYSWNYDNWVAVTEWALLPKTRPERFKRKPGGFKACPRTNYPNARGPHFSQ